MGRLFQVIWQGLASIAERFRPPPGWQLPVTILLGILTGLGVLLFDVSQASSYLSDNPATCVNCHVMAPEYASWSNSKHRLAATCNDCHVPHDNYLRHYAFKASDGARHAFMFTFRLEPQVIRIHEAGQRVVQQNCVRCHVNQLDDTKLALVPGDASPEDGMRCWGCHTGTPHGDVRGLASAPYEHVPLVESVTPTWLSALMEDRAPAPNAEEQP
jgi:cytochrome c nitrite reductase small subunit